MEPQTSCSLTEQIAQRLAREIITGERRANTRIQELGVAGEMKVSRGSVREALLLLEARYLVDIPPRRGAIVRDLSRDEIANFSGLYSNLQIYLFNKLAAKNSPQMRLDLNAAVQLLETTMAEGDRYASVDAQGQFVATATSLAEDGYLSDVMQDLIPASKRIAYLAVAQGDCQAADIVRYHQSLVQAIFSESDERIKELVCAFNAREQRLAAKVL